MLALTWTYHRYQQYYPQTQLIILHCNHHTRSTNQTEQQLIIDYTQGLITQVYHYSGDNYSENELRKRRRSCVAQAYQHYQASLVVTGHHRDDKHETSLLNLYRGCGLLGLNNMSHYDQKYIDHQSKNGTSGIGHRTLRIRRPLLSLTKKQILDSCHRHQIPYALDPSNADARGGHRTRIRHQLIPTLYEDKRQAQEYRKPIYATLHNYKQRLQDSIKITPIPQNTLRKTTRAYHIVQPTTVCIDHLILILQQLGIYRNASQGLLTELLHFLTTSSGGRKHYNNTTFFVCHRERYAIHGPQRFRQKIVASPHTITSITPFVFGDQHIQPTPSDIGAQVRFYQPGDSYQGHKITKQWSKQHIPLFYRSTIPLLTKNGIIQQLFLDHIPSCDSFGSI